MKERRYGEAMEDKWNYYTTKDGDTWDKISYLLYKNSKFIHYLNLWNEEYSEYFIFPAGIVLKYKEIDMKSSNVPPWRR